jgi:hypothetical protein
LLFFLCSHDSPCGRKEKCCLDKDTKYKKEKRKKKKQGVTFGKVYTRMAWTGLNLERRRRSEPGGVGRSEG